MSSEVGTGHVSIFPVLTGFRGRVVKSVKEAGSAAAKTFEGGFKRAGTAAGRGLGRDLKASLSAAAGDLGAAELTKLNRSVSTASAALGRARLKQQDEAGKVRIAEVRLAEAIKASGEGSVQAVAAEERLEAARRRQGAALDAVASATTRLKGAQDALNAATVVTTATSAGAGAALSAALANLRAGYGDARAGQSAFTGLAGSVGGIAKELVILGRNIGAGTFGLMRLLTRQAYTGFTSLATLVGGRLAKAFQRPARAISDLGARISNALAPVGYFAVGASQIIVESFRSAAGVVGSSLAGAASRSIDRLRDLGASVGQALAPIRYFAVGAGQILATPFVQLGTRVAGFMRPVAARVGSAFRGAREQIISHLAPLGAQVSALFAKIPGIGGTAGTGFVARFRAGVAGLGGAAATAFQSLTGAAQRAGTAAGQALGNGIKNTATAGVAALAATVGVALTSGFGRLNAIDTARAKLVGLGNDGTTVAKIMSDATASVRGTSFGLGEAATVAAAAVAAGIRPGEALQGHLKSIANNASAAGISMQEMGSIFNRAATQANGVQNDVISQLADRGIPIYQALADQMGVTAGEVFKLASEGKVDFETFSRAATAAAGTVADEIGGTVPGAFKNMFASLGRIGANVFGGINKETGEMYGLYARLAPLIKAVTSALGPLEERAAELGAKLDTILGPALDGITAFFNRIGEAGGLAGTGLEGILGIAGPLGGVLAALGAGGLASLLARLGPLGALLPGLGGALAALASPLGLVIAGLAGFALTGGDAGALVGSITGIIDSVVAALPALVSQVAAVVPQILTALLAQLPALLGAGVEIVGVLVQGLVTALPVIATGAVSLVTGLITAIVAALPMIITGAIALVTALIDGIVTAIPLLISAAITLVTGLLTAIIGALPMIIEGGLQLLVALVTGILNALPTLITAVLDLVLTLLDTLIANLPAIIEGGITLLLSLVQGIVSALPQLIVAAINLIVQLVVALLTMLPKLIEAGIELIVALIVGLVEAIPQIIEMLPQIVSAIWDGLSAVDWASLGMQILQALIDGMLSMIGAVGDAVGTVVEHIAGFFPNSPAKRGPLSGAGWTKLRRSGAATMDQFSAGALDEAPTFGDAMAAAAAGASQRAQAQLGSVSATVTAGVTASRTNAVPPAEGTPPAGDGRDGPTFINHFPEGMSPQGVVDIMRGQFGNGRSTP